MLVMVWTKEARAGAGRRVYVYLLLYRNIATEVQAE